MTAPRAPLARHPAPALVVLPRERSALDPVVVVAGLVLAAGWVVQLPIVMAAGLGVLVLLLAATRFDTFVLFLLVARSALDATKGGGSLSATTVLGAVFLVAVLIREVLIRSSGQSVTLLRSPVRTPLMALLAISVLSGVLSDSPTGALTECLRLAGVVAMVIALERMLVTSDSAAKVLVAVFLSSIAPMAMGVYQLALGQGRLIGGFSRVQGTFTHPNPFSIYLAILLVLAAALVRHVRGWSRIGLVLVLVVGGTLLVATFTRGSWLALLVGLMVVGGLQSKKLIAAMLTVVVGIVVAVPPVRARFTDLLGSQPATEGAGNSLVWRLQHWKDALALAHESPIIGIGLKGIERSTADGANAHNDLVRIGVETGFVGLLIYFSLAAALIWTARRALSTAPDGWRRGAAVGYAGMLGVLGVASLSSNIITQVVLLWYVAAISIAVVAVSPSVAAPQGRRRSTGDGTIQPLPERVGPVRAEPPRTPAVPPRQQPGVGATPPRGQEVSRRPASVPAAPLPKRPTGVPRRAKNPDQGSGRGNPSGRPDDFTYGNGSGPAGFATPPGGGQEGPLPRAGEDGPWR